MVDYGPGDEIVYVASYDDQIHSTNSIYVCEDMRPSLNIDNINSYQLRKICGNCKTPAHKIVAVLSNLGSLTNTWVCACSFRKKLDFKKLCNVDETTKIKEDA